MRTTVELTNEQRAALLAKAAQRGIRGYSSLVQEALAQYLSLPTPPPAKKKPSKKGKSGESLLAFVCDGFSTRRPDGSARHDDYIYRGR